ncbi:MAG: metallophosphoesterase family protein [Anaerolineaceae bacterium]
MSSRKNKKYFTILVIIIILIIAVSGFIYGWHLRQELLQIRSEYKTIYEEMREDIAVLEEELISQGSFVTDKFTGQYEFIVDPNNVTLNSIHVDVPTDDSPITIITGGHIYGNPYNEGIPTVASTVTDYIDTLNTSNADFFVSLGDMTYLPSLESIQSLEQDFLNKLTIPVFNSVGNHDMKNGRTFYEENFGQTYYSFSYGSAQIIVLDTVLSHCYIEGHQQEMLESVFQNSLQDEDIDTILIFIHKLVFLEDEDLVGRANGTCEYGTNFSELRDELLIPASRVKPIYIFAGDVGAFGGNLSPFYYQYPESNLYTIAVGVGDSENDAFLRIDIENGIVQLNLLALKNGEFKEVANYTPDYWLLQPH